MADWGAIATAWLAPSLISGTALWCANLYSNRQLEIGWYKEFRELNKEFWEDETIKIVRAWIACDEAYEEIETILDSRIKNKVITKDQYESLDKIDTFCALMTRIMDLDTRPRTKRQREMWQHLYFEYWLKTIDTRRPALKAYISIAWERIPFPVKQSSENTRLLP